MCLCRVFVCGAQRTGRRLGLLVAGVVLVALISSCLGAPPDESVTAAAPQTDGGIPVVEPYLIPGLYGCVYDRLDSAVEVYRGLPSLEAVLWVAGSCSQDWAGLFQRQEFSFEDCVDAVNARGAELREWLPDSLESNMLQLSRLLFGYAWCGAVADIGKFDAGVIDEI